MNILIVQGHPDPRAARFGRALSTAYGDGAREAGHQVTIVDVASLEFPLIRTKEEFDTGDVPAPIRDVQAAIDAAGHLVVFYPLWVGTMPALLKAFFEQVFRPVFVNGALNSFSTFRLKGKTAHVVVTMGMPSFAYRLWVGALGPMGLERFIFRICGIGPVRQTFIGAVEASAEKRARWIERMRIEGSRAR